MQHRIEQVRNIVMQRKQQAVREPGTVQVRWIRCCCAHAQGLGASMLSCHMCRHKMSPSQAGVLLRTADVPPLRAISGFNSTHSRCGLLCSVLLAGHAPEDNCNKMSCACRHCCSAQIHLSGEAAAAGCQHLVAAHALQFVPAICSRPAPAGVDEAQCCLYLMSAGPPCC